MQSHVLLRVYLEQINSAYTIHLAYSHFLLKQYSTCQSLLDNSWIFVETSCAKDYEDARRHEESGEYLFAFNKYESLLHHRHLSETTIQLFIMKSHFAWEHVIARKKMQAATPTFFSRDAKNDLEECERDLHLINQCILGRRTDETLAKRILKR